MSWFKNDKNYTYALDKAVSKSELSLNESADYYKKLLELKEEELKFKSSWGTIPSVFSTTSTVVYEPSVFPVVRRTPYSDDLEIVLSKDTIITVHENALALDGYLIPIDILKNVIKKLKEET